MRRCIYGSAVALALACGLASAAPPVVTAPEKVYGETGDWVFFAVTTDGKGVKFVPLDTGLSLFPSGKLKDPNETAARATKPGTYRVLIYTGNADGPSEPKVVAVVFGGPAPGPDPVPLPDGKFGLIKVSREGAAKVSDRSLNGALAKSQRAIASAIQAGGLVAPADILKAWRDGNNAAVSSAVWKPWGDAVTPALQKLHADGKLFDKATWAAAFIEIAEGLEQ